jgi:hypothetical protein
MANKSRRWARDGAAPCSPYVDHNKTGIFEIGQDLVRFTSGTDVHRAELSGNPNGGAGPSGSSTIHGEILTIVYREDNPIITSIRLQ